MSKIAIVILNWNQPKLTIECLESIKELNTKGLNLLTIVVDNGSSDDSVEIIRRSIKSSNGIKSIKNHDESVEYAVLKNSENLGFAAGNNVGIDYALKEKCDYILILNNDTTVDENMLVNFLEVQNKYPDAGVISPKIFFAKGFEFQNKYKDSELGKVIWSAGGDMDWDNIYGTNHGVDEVDDGQFEKVRDIDFATGACMFLPAKIVKEVGKFDEKYFMYLEDVDLTQRIIKNGYRAIYSPKSVIWHKVAQSSKIGGDLNDYFITRNRLLFGVGVFGNGYAKLRTKIALTREAIRLLFTGRKWQRIGVRDFYLLRYGRGSWPSAQ